MAENAFVTWLQHPAPWEIEGELIRELRPPLNLADNSHHSFHGQLSQLRRDAKARAVKVGDVLHEAPTQLHTVENLSPVKLLVVRVIEKGKEPTVRLQ